MQTLIGKILFLLSYLPFMRLPLNHLYDIALKKITSFYQQDQRLIDIAILSNLQSSDFISGRSQITLLLITKNNIHPKTFLLNFREVLSSTPLFSFVFNQEFIPILTENELKIDVLRGFLLRNSLRDTIKWKSLLLRKDYVFYLGKQDEFSINYTSFQSLSRFFLQDTVSTPYRIKVKNTKRSLQNFIKQFPHFFSQHPEWNKLSTKIIKFPMLKLLYSGKLKKLTWKALTAYPPPPVKGSLQLSALKSEQLKFLHRWIELDFIEDIFITPSIIQYDPDIFKGKLYLDIIVNEQVIKNLNQLTRIEKEIKKSESRKLKFRVRITTTSLFSISLAYSLYPFPLEPLLRKQTGVSLQRKKYDLNVEYDFIIFASIHFLTSQFMRFRSLEQKSDLIDSKFIKSLNLMYKYHLLNEFLEGNEFDPSHSPEEIRKKLTPQFASLELNDKVRPRDWQVIEAQMKYLLKKIRVKLSRFDDSLNELRF